MLLFSKIFICYYFLILICYIIVQYLHKGILKMVGRNKSFLSCEELKLHDY